MKKKITICILAIGVIAIISLYFVKKSKEVNNINQDMNTLPVDYNTNEAEVSQEEQQKVQEISRRTRARCGNSNLRNSSGI